MDDKLLTPGEVCDILKISVSTLYKMVSKRRIPYKKISNKLLRFSQKEIDKWLRSKSIKDDYADNKQEILDTII
ncbi:MAG: helix-turn-helix transcriptional regulator [Candidatus Aminicenantaceae bacterium]